MWTGDRPEYCNGEAFQSLSRYMVIYGYCGCVHVYYICIGSKLAEYCIGEDFQPRCTGNDVIVMLSARYGRMKVGRCVEVEPGFESMLEDPRYLGCSTDVLDVVSRQCSGRSECTLRVNDQNFNNVKPCFTSLKMYLEVAYLCVSGELISCCLLLV